MGTVLAAQLCRIVPPEKLGDRLLTSGVIRQADHSLLQGQVILGYIFEVTHPMFTTSTVLPTILEVLQRELEHFSPDKNVDDQFELLLKEVNERLNVLSESGETDWIGNLHGIITAMTGEELHFAQTGRCPAYLLQNNRIRQITDDTNTEHDLHPLKTFSNLASGQLREGDQILFSNTELYRELSLDALRRVLNNGTPFQSSQMIARELKRERNQSVAALVVRVIPQEELPTQPEPEEIHLEIEMQSGFSRVKRSLTPFATSVKKVSTMIAQASLEAAKTTGSVVKEKVVPKAGEIIQKGVEKAQTFREAPVEEPSAFLEETPSEPPVVEIIPSKKQRERAHLQAMAEAAESRAEHRSEAEQEEDLIPLDELSLESQQPAAGATIVKKLLHTLTVVLPHMMLKALGHVIRWLQVARNRKIAALGVGILLLTTTIWLITKPKETKQTAVASLENAKLLVQAKQLDEEIGTAVQLQQLVEAGRKIEEAQKAIVSLKDPAPEQLAEANTLWSSINQKADNISATTRLSMPVAVYSFPQDAGTLLSSLPYFFGSAKDSNELLRTGRGDPTQVDKRIALPDQNDSAISIARSSEVDSVSYVLTKQSRVYRLVQSGADTALREVTTKDGSFDVGDAIASYAGNVYILDGKTGLLWKYTNAGNGSYSSRESVVDGTKYDIRKSVSLAIDGSIYVLKLDGTLSKFTRGKQDAAFSLKDQPFLSRKLVQPLQVITSDTMSSIFVLDGGNTAAGRSTAKVLEFAKNGSFTRQYAFPDDCTNVHGFDINPKEKKLWILNGSDVKEFDI